MPVEFYSGTDWEESSGPYINLMYDGSVDLWPWGINCESDGAGDKDLLADGLHPCLAIGDKANRATNDVGVMVTYNAAADLAIMNVAQNFMFKAYVANVLTYGGGNPATFDTSLAVGDPVYVDDSPALTDGVTLSRSPLNAAGNGNPLAGYIDYPQDAYADFPVGGPNCASSMPITVANSFVETLVTVKLA
jgi:hypothetical protein